MSSSGPKPQFDRAELRRALRVIGKKGPIGRKSLTGELDLGEGSVRTILKRLKDSGLIVSTPGGHELTEKGEGEMKESPELLELDAGELTVGETDVAAVVRSAASKIRFGVEERDEAIKAGAKGATVLVFKNGELVFPDETVDVETRVESELEDFFHLENGDVVIIGTGQNRKQAEKGVLAAVEYLSS